MDVWIGIDLGSTTTKAVVMDESGDIVGRGITNSRSNYDVAARIVREEALVNTRFSLMHQRVADQVGLGVAEEEFVRALERDFRLHQHLEQLDSLRDEMQAVALVPRHERYQRELRELIESIADEMSARSRVHYSERSTRKSDFFRDLAAADYMGLAEQHADPKGITFETLSGIFDAAILVVENSAHDGAFARHIVPALEKTLAEAGPLLAPHAGRLREAVEAVRATEVLDQNTVGTGYGRQRLPFPKEQIRSEILCHGLGAHALFPGTRTVLDIGGQDTKAIQTDDSGIVTSFQMNDRCAAGCGRYLGYIADEMNLGLHELGPLAQKSSCRVKINSTCTVFAGAELRDRLSLGQRREDILAGLHRAIILRALSLLARSGGIEEEFTFTGGVARNLAAVAALRDLVEENYGHRTLNISTESIYTGALGAALFARRGAEKAAA
ncbi:MAG TPA: BadF/BadG/BcrA/BcrD ATPase family protein [Thermoanaerobaculia bacterium]|nr:BadF/BadG/BcrA/BcrD ATPase family protein [Thermoanaerobaculia bacterium]